MNAGTGRLTWLGEYDSKVLTFRPHKDGPAIDRLPFGHDTSVMDGVLIAIDATKTYLAKDQTTIDASPATATVVDRNE